MQPRAYTVATLFLLNALTLQGCAISKEIYLPSGAKGYSVSCDGAAVGINVCFEKASELCGARGYNLLNREGLVIPMAVGSSNFGGTAQGFQGQSFVFGGAFSTKSIMIQCRD